MLDKSGFYWTFRSRQANTFKISYELRHALYLKGWKMALVSARLPPPPDKKDGSVTFSCMATYPKLISETADTNVFANYQIVRKKYFEHGKYSMQASQILLRLINQVITDMQEDGLDKLGISIDRTIEVNENSFQLVHNHDVAPQVSLAFNTMASQAMGLPPSYEVYHVAAKKKSAQERLADAKLAAKNAAIAEYEEKMQLGEEVEGGWQSLVPKDEDLQIKEEGPDVALIYDEDQLLHQIHKLFKLPDNVRVKTNIQYSPVNELSQDSNLAIGQLIPYAQMIRQSPSCYYEVPRLRYYHVTPVEINRVEIRILSEDGHIINHAHDTRIIQKVELTYHFIPPDHPNGENDTPYPITYTSYMQMFGREIRERREKEMKLRQEAARHSDFNLADSFMTNSTDSQPSSETNMFELAQAAGFNKFYFSNKASTSAGFGN